MSSKKAGTMYYEITKDDFKKPHFKNKETQGYNIIIKVRQ